MKVLSLLQPWASLIAIGAKKIETRSWPAPAPLIGQRIAIHASKGFPIKNRQFMLKEPCRTDLVIGGYTLADIPLGAVIATARLVKVIKMTEGNIAQVDELELEYGYYEPGRSMWMLEDVDQFEHPITAKGALGLWEWEMPEILPRNCFKFPTLKRLSMSCLARISNNHLSEPHAPDRPGRTRISMRRP